ncbi:DUF4350 domain-containing protein [Maribacter sp. CXY002]|uniref:DUF4350 domain-containing protein n=1 Tax=Maribacter luteocoastalis TaxID=3407671 RepID=UPI003B6710A0
MRKKGTFYSIGLLATLAVLMLLQYNKPKELNWFESFVGTHKIPYGTFIFNELITNTLYPNKVTQITLSPFEFLTNEDNPKGTYVFINNTIQFDEVEFNRLLEWTAKGNTLFIAAEGFDEHLSDTLKIKTSMKYGGFETAQKQNHKLVNPNFKNDHDYSYEKTTAVIIFSELDTTNTTVLATVTLPSESKPEEIDNVTAIHTNFGSGEIILSTFPKAFTNYFILEDNNKDYTAGLSTYLNNGGTIYIDNHYKSGKAFYTSPMYIFLNTKELKWAYYIVLIGALIYVIFEGKRKQRAIPVIKPLENQTLAFTRTISDMYFEKNDQKTIVGHKINYFLNYLRNKYYVDSNVIDDDFLKKLALKSGHTLEQTKTLFSYIEQLKNKAQITDSELIDLNQLIQKYKFEPNGK